VSQSDGADNLFTSAGTLAHRCFSFVSGLQRRHEATANAEPLDRIQETGYKILETRRENGFCNVSVFHAGI
jgi:hypothetical protein